MANNFAEAMQQGYAFGAQQRQDRERRSKLAELAGLSSKVIGGDYEATNRAYALDPQTAKTYQSEGDRRREQLVGMARGWKSVPSEQRQAYYERFIAPAVSQMGFGDLGQYDENAVDGVATQILAAYGGGKMQNPYDGLPSDIQSLKLLQSDPTLAALDKERRQYSSMVPKLVETNQGIGWGTPGGGIDLAPVTGVAGGTGNGGFGIKETNDYVRSILGKVQGLDPNAPAEKQAEALLPYLIQQESGGNPNAVSPKGARGLTQVMPATGQDPGFGVIPLRDGSPQENVRFGRDYLTAMLRRYPGRPDLALAAYNAGPGVADRFANPQASNAPNIAQPYTKPQAPSELERRIEAARAMGASEDEIRRMVIGRDGAAAGAKPLPPDALKALLAVEDAMAAAQNVSSMIKKHSQRMADGSLVVGPVDSIAAQFRTRLGMSNANDVNLNEYRADLTKIVNESLRLNSGVQTEGDAQRAANELMDANDPATAARALRRLQEYNTRAIELQKRKMELVRRNYGQDPSGNPAPQRAPSQSGGVDDLLSKYGAN